jgi:hypothetical protein
MHNLPTKILSSLLLVIILIVSFRVTPNTPRVNAVVPVTDPGNTGTNISKLLKAVWTGTLDSKTFWKEFVLDQVAFTIAQKMSERMVKSTINWANSGFKGENPLYIGDLGAVVRSLEENEALLFLQEGVLNGSAPFAKDVAKMLVKEYTTSYREITKFTLEEFAGEDFDKYQAGDFAAGGWATWTTNNLPQNNTLGLYEKSKNELARRIAKKRELELEKLKQNSGFRDVSECPEAMRVYTNTNVGGGVVNTTGPQPTEAEIIEHMNQTGLDYDIARADLIQSAGQNNSPQGSGEYTCLQTATTTPGKAVESLLTQAIKKPGTSVDNISKWGQLLISSLTKLSDGLTKVGVAKIYGEVDSQISTFYADAVELIDEGDYTAEQSNNSIGFNITNNQEIISFIRTLDGHHPENEGELDDEGKVIQGHPGVLEELENEIDFYKQSIELLTTFPQKVLSLDRCLPGPDTGWEGRLQSKFDNAIQKLFRKANRSDKDKWSNRLSSRNTAFILFNQKVKLFTLTAKPATPGDPESGDTIEAAPTVSNMVIQVKNYLSEQDTLIDTLVEKSTLLNSLRLLRDQWDTANSATKQNILQNYKTLSSQLNLISGSKGAEVRLLQFQRISEEMSTLLLICSAQKAVKFGSSSVILNTIGGILDLPQEERDAYLDTLSEEERAQFEELLGAQDTPSVISSVNVLDIERSQGTLVDIYAVTFSGEMAIADVENATLTLSWDSDKDSLEQGNGREEILPGTYASGESFEETFLPFSGGDNIYYQVCSDVTSAGLDECSPIKSFTATDDSDGSNYESIFDLNTRYFSDTEKSNQEIFNFCYKFINQHSILLHNRYKYKGISCTDFYYSNISDYLKPN